MNGTGPAALDSTAAPAPGAFVRRAVWLVAIVDVIRLVGAIPLGLGDAEALYACYANHLQGGYLDHPPLIGWLDAAVLSVCPGAFALRLLALGLFTLSAWLLFRLARTLFDDAAAFWAVAILCVLPVFHLGGLAAAPDAPLVPLWLATLLAAWHAWKRQRESRPPSWGWVLSRAVGLGALLGAAFLAKYSALALAPVLCWAAWPLPPARRWAAWLAGAVAAAAVATPVIAWNAAHGFASVLHRFVWSQPDPGASLRNAGALVGGQLLYLSPVAAVALGWMVVRAWKRRGESPVRFCLVASLVPFAILAAICVWSRVAEPHWPLPAILALLPLAGHAASVAVGRTRRVVRVALGVAVAFDAAVYLAVLTPLLPALVPEPLYVARYDIVNELYGWDRVADAVRRRVPAGGVVVAGHYTMCAQLEWNLRGTGIPVACWTCTPTDFDLWAPGAETTRGRPVLFVSDERYPDRPPAASPQARPERAEGPPVPNPPTVSVRRGGTEIRRFVLTDYAAGEVRWPRRVAGCTPPSGGDVPGGREGRGERGDRIHR
ncbi:MAG: glycosyltransferase family 39 protein [Deltaproteobacteria bacterium]|nr:glycosyltransferase family 39 protein [Deltaproteobacteria bacterium]